MMATRFDKQKEDNDSIVQGYESANGTTDYVIPSCGLEDLDYAVFNLFNSQIPLHYEIQGEQKRVPVIFATGERFAILRRNKPLTDRSGALILPLISIARTGLEQVPQKGMANNQMFPEVMVRRIHDKNTEWRQLNNFEGFQHIAHSNVERKTSFNLGSQLEKNIYETIEVPPVRYFGATYQITIWSSFTQQMNDITTAIMSAYTINPGQQFRIESKKGYWFPAFIDSSFSQDASYNDFTNEERFVKSTMTLNTTGYILAPNIFNGKVSLKSLVSAPNISFDVMAGYEDLEPQARGIASNDPDARILDHLQNEKDGSISQQVGIPAFASLEALQGADKNDAFIGGSETSEVYEVVGERSTDASKLRKVVIRDAEGELVNIRASIESNGEILYDQKYAEKIFNISNSNK